MPIIASVGTVAMCEGNEWLLYSRAGHLGDAFSFAFKSRLIRLSGLSVYQVEFRVSFRGSEKVDTISMERKRGHCRFVRESSSKLRPVSEIHSLSFQCKEGTVCLQKSSAVRKGGWKGKYSESVKLCEVQEYK
jgi:hypothetical protein